MGIDRSSGGLNRLLRPFWLRLQLMVGRFVIAAVNEDPKLRVLQLTGLPGEILDGVEFFNQYGFACHPIPGAEAVGVSVGSVRDHTIVIATADRRYKLTTAEGEVGIHDDQDQKVHLKRDSISIETPFDVYVNAGGKIEAVAATTVKVSGAGLVTIEATAAAVNVKATGGDVVVESTSGQVQLGGSGGPEVARKGDAVSGGVIVGGSSKVRAVD